MSVIEMRDPKRQWGGATSDGYDPKERLTRASNGRGNSVEVRVKVPPETASEIAALVQSGRVAEYQTNADVLRDALYHRLHWIRDHDLRNDEDLARQVQLDLTIAKADARAKEIERRKEMVGKISQVLRDVARHGSEGDWLAVKHHAEDVAAILDEPWQSQVEVEIGEARGMYVERIRGRRHES